MSTRPFFRMVRVLGKIEMRELTMYKHRIKISPLHQLSRMKEFQFNCGIPMKIDIHKSNISRLQYLNLWFEKLI